ncbi:MAG TPA: ATP-binding protein, partial [Planctomycetota bacterium]|nr:ATP-binding protein [Planctomycetota bacterium]
MTIDRQQPNEHAGTSRPGRASLGRRLTLATLVVLGAAFAISGSLQLRSTRDALTRQMDGLGSTLARSAAASMVEWVLERRYTYVQTYVDSVVSEDPRVGFMAVTLPDGTVIAARPDVDPRADAPIPDCRVFRAPIRVPADPSLASLGTVNLGLRAEHAAQLVTERTRETLTIFTATFAALVLVVTWLLRSMLHQPLLQLDDQARRLGRGDLERPVTVDSRTELGRLAQTLDHMRVNLRASHQSIAQQNEQLLVLDRMKAEFLANLSHELRTPLTAMIGFTSLLAESDLPAEAAAQVEPIRRNALHLHSLLNELLDLARLGTGELLIENCPFDPRALLVDLAEFLRPRATGKGLALTVTPREPLPAQVIGDPTRVRQVLLQVVGNAIKFTERGEVALELSATTRDGTPWIEYRVRDTGPGVPPALQARLFAPWTQGDGALSRRVQGLGIGLSIAREIAARLGGDLRCT